MDRKKPMAVLFTAIKVFEKLLGNAGTGWDAIQAQLKKLEAKHALHIASYGEGNERRLTGKHETSSMHDFRYIRVLACLTIASRQG